MTFAVESLLYNEANQSYKWTTEGWFPDSQIAFAIIDCISSARSQLSTGRVIGHGIQMLADIVVYECTFSNSGRMTHQWGLPFTQPYHFGARQPVPWQKEGF